jgi:hypothetical protein
LFPNKVELTSFARRNQDKINEAALVQRRYSLLDADDTIEY